MRKNIFIISLTFILGLASCSFTSSNFDQTDKDKLLVQLISYVLDQGHFVKKEINDDFSRKVFNEYLNILDPYKRYFYKSDIEEFKKYKDQLDDKLTPSYMKLIGGSLKQRRWCRLLSYLINFS